MNYERANNLDLNVRRKWDVDVKKLFLRRNMSFSNNHVNANKSRSASRFAREYTEQYSCFVASIATKTLRKILSDFLVKELILFNVLRKLHFYLVAWFKVLADAAFSCKSLVGKVTRVVEEFP